MEEALSKLQRRHAKPAAAIALIDGGVLREREVLALLGMSRSSWRAGIAGGIYPKPIQMGIAMNRWRTREIKQLAENGISRAVA